VKRKYCLAEEAAALPLRQSLSLSLLPIDIGNDFLKKISYQKTTGVCSNIKRHVNIY
jgi:hypothetical protein